MKGRIGRAYTYRVYILELSKHGKGKASELVELAPR